MRIDVDGRWSIVIPLRLRRRVVKSASGASAVMESTSRHFSEMPEFNLHNQTKVCKINFSCNLMWFKPVKFKYSGAVC